MIDKTKLGKIFEPFNIGGVRVRNRMIKTASGIVCTNEYCFTGERRKAFYEALAKGGIGLIIVEPCPVEYPRGAYQPDLLRIDDDKFLPSLNDLTKAIHNHGCPAFLQLVHAGAWRLVPSDSTEWVPPWPTGLQRVSASSLFGSELPEPWFDASCKELTIAEIKELVDKFAIAAERAQKVGIDGVEINAGTCHLVNSFLSRVWNSRQDAYGCSSLENRARFAVEIIREIKKRLGQDFPVIMLINGAEYGIDKGTTIEEAKEFAQILQNAGADAIHVRAYGYGDYTHVDSPEHVFFPEPPKPLVKELDWSHKGAGLLVPLAAAIKSVVSIPVITVGRLDHILGEEILRKGSADFIGFTRLLFADPELPNKIAAGRLEDVTPCRACLECSPILPIRCGVNAALGGDAEYYAIKPAEKRKTVVIVGGGPAGMEAARVAAIRGHEVILYEKEYKLGGLLSLAALVKGLEIEDMEALVRYFKIQINKLGVKTRLGKMFNFSLIQEIKPDVVILATGGIPTLPEIHGINSHNVVKAADLHAKLKIYLRFLGPKVLRWITRFWMPVGKKVIIIGGAIQGCELAEFLVKRGRKVTVVETSEDLGKGLTELKKVRLFRWLTKKGVAMITGVKYDEITDKGLAIITKDGK
jgi:2,4-dienoyl-CoA reductase (NADPH2)